ncbi:MAG TPA: hypothetical protein DEO40_01085 [Treponema sp.]|nr:hypothetical protein [Treponema sp.]
MTQEFLPVNAVQRLLRAVRKPCDKKQKECLGKPAPIEAPLVDRRSGSDEDDERQRRAESGKKLPKKTGLLKPRCLLKIPLKAIQG